MNSGAADPYTDTEPCGFPRGGVESFGVSHGSIFGCSLKSVNHEQPQSATSTNPCRWRRFALRSISFAESTPSAKREGPLTLALTAHLLSSMLLEQLDRFIGLLRGRLDPHAEIAV